MKNMMITILASSSLALLSCQQAASPPQPASSVAGPGAACDQTDERILNIKEIRQLGNNWCWAASSEMVLAHYNQRVPQCQQVNDRFGFTQCCGLVIEPECDQTGWPDFARYNLLSQRTNSAALSWDQIKSEVACKGNPIAFTWKWPGGAGHMMVVKGFRSVNGVNLVMINDPAKKLLSNFIRYDIYVKSEGNHTHWDDFYDFRK
jgi:hypothetical protein